ncbi:MAG: DUF3795 domain-containing protein [Candidatus Thorarchaeota archaeon]
MNSEMIACCGLDCSGCPAIKAKQNNDDELRKKTAQDWSQPEYEVPFQDVNCDGCRQSSDETIFKHWPPNCPVRNCVFERKLENCANCDDYICDKLDGVLKMMGSAAKDNLEKIRSAM